MAHQPCRHCGARPGSHKRGFCWGCYHTPAIVALYPADQSRNSQGGDAAWEYTALPPPPEPTQAVPGSEEKLRVMEWRDQNGYQVFHPQDNVPDHRRGSSVWEAVVGELARRMED